MLSPLMFAGASLVAPVLAANVVSINLTPRQTLTSIGASGAWWPNDLQYFPYEKQKELADTLFSPNGIWLSSYRYNLGAAGDNDTHYCYTPNRVVESPLLTNGTYDFSRDQAGQRFLEYAQNHSVPYITFFLNSLPSHINPAKQAFGYQYENNATEDFAAYIATVLSHYTDKGIDIKYISPMNEPDYQHPYGDQEGMAVGPDKRGYVFEAITRHLSTSSANKTRVIGDETSQPVAQGDFTFMQWLPNSTSVVSNLAVHNYDYPTDADMHQFYNNVVNLTKNTTLPPVKFTEACCATSAGTGAQVFGAQYDPTMTNALIVAREVWQFFTIAQAESFDWWSSVSELPCSPTVDGDNCYKSFNATNGFNSALVYIDGAYNTTKDYNFYLTKRTYVIKHFAHFIRPGSVRYDVDTSALPGSITALATKSPRSSTPGVGKDGFWNIMFMNNATTPETFDFQVPDKADVLLQIYQTTPTVDWGKVPIIPYVLHTGRMSITLPGQSIWSMRFAKAY